MKIVVTGALGHIGSRLIRTLPAAFPDAEIVLLDNLLTQRYCSLFNLPNTARYRFLELDVLTADLPEVFRGADAVIHLAAITDAANSFQIKDQVEAVNFQGTERVARACVKARCPMVFLSTTSVYGTQEGLVDEDCSDADLKPQSPYAESKLRAERLLAELGSKDGLDFAACRFGTIFGTSIGMRFHTAVNKFCWQAVMRQPLTVWRTALRQKRPYLDLGDAVAAIEFILKNGLCRRTIYNVVTKNFTVEDILEAIRRHVPDLSVRQVDDPIMNQLSYEVSNARFRKRGFSFSGSLETGIAETIQLLRSANSHDEKKEDLHPVRV